MADDTIVMTNMIELLIEAILALLFALGGEAPTNVVEVASSPTVTAPAETVTAVTVPDPSGPSDVGPVLAGPSTTFDFIPLENETNTMVVIVPSSTTVPES